MVRKDSLVKGTVIIAAAAMVARVLGVFQRVPLDHLMGKVGGAAFGTANNVYLLLLVVATAGIPSAISKMVSERLELGREAEAQGIYRAALGFGIGAGIVMAAGLFLAAPWYARLADNPDAAPAIRAIAPSLLLFPVIAMMRGYFQGRQFMMAGGVSQIVEQIARVVTAVGLAVALVEWGYGDPEVAAGAAFGSVLGSVAAFAVMLAYARKLRQAGANEGPAPRPAAPAGSAAPPVLRRTRDIYAAIFRTSIPILLTAMTIQLIYLIDQTLLIPLSKAQFGKETAMQWLDILQMRAQSIAGIPPVLAIALSTSLLPVVAAAYAAGDADRVRRQIALAMRIAVFTGLPVVAALSTGAYAVNALLFSSAEGSLIVGWLTAGTLFQITMMTSNSILNGLSRNRTAMGHTLTGIGVKTALSFALTPWAGVYGLLASDTVCFIVVTAWNMASIRRLTGVRVLAGRWPGWIGAVAVVTGVGFLAAWAGSAWFAPLGWKWPYLLTAVLVGAATLASYPAVLAAFRVVRPADLEAYPSRLRRLLAPFMRLQGRRSRQGAGVNSSDEPPL